MNQATTGGRGRRPLREVAVRSRGSAIAWTWGAVDVERHGGDDGAGPPVKVTRLPEGEWIAASDPKMVLDDSGILVPRGANAALTYGRPIRGCTTGGDHRAAIGIGRQQIGPLAIWALSRKAKCMVCNAGVPSMFGDDGRFIPDLVTWSTPSGLLDVGDCYEVEDKDIPMSKESVAAKRAKHIVVVLPGGVKAAITAPRSSGSQDGFRISGSMPRITVTPEIDVETWRGSIVNGELIDQ